MEIFYLFMPLALFLIGLVIAAFFWAVNHDQFEDLEHQGERILFDDAPKNDSLEK